MYPCRGLLLVSGFLNVDVFTAGGSSTIASLLPTKTLAFGGDIWPDQPDVPAFFNLPFFPKMATG